MTSALATTRSRQAASQTPVVLVALAIAAAYWIIGNRLDQSVRIREQMSVSFDSMKNEFAERQKDTTGSSVVGYFLLGGVGVVCWLTAPPGRLRWSGPALILGLAWVAWCGVSIAWSLDQFQTLRKLTIFGLLLVAAAGMAAKFELRELFDVVILLTGAMLAIGFLAEAAYGMFLPWRSDYRFSGTMHPNDQGLQCAVLALVAATAAESRVAGKNLRRFLVVAALAGLALSKSRTTLAALVFAGLVYLFLHGRGSQRWLVASTALAVGGLAGGLYSFVSVSALRETASVAEMGRSENVSSLTGRLPLWEGLWPDVMKRPLLGYGYGGYWGPKNILRHSKANGWHIPHAHNSYLDLVLATGIIGLALYVAWVLAVALVGAMRYDATGDVAHLTAACLLGLGLVHGLSESKIPGAEHMGFVVLAVMVFESLQRPLLKRAASEVMRPAAVRSQATRPQRWRRTARVGSGRTARSFAGVARGVAGD
jgi:O-antigen ligase